MKDPFKPNSIGDYLAAIFLIAIFFIAFSFFWRANITTQEKGSEKILIRAPECPNSFESYRTLVAEGSSLRLSQDIHSYGSNGKFVGDENITVNRSGSGEVACGYLYLRARIDGRPLDERYESIYIAPQGLGGYILRTKSIPISNPKVNTSEALISLDAISYLPSLPYNPNAQNYKLANWVKLINVSNKTVFHVALSAENTAGVIDEIIIAYKCWNPVTGQESHDCQLSIE